MDFQPEYLRSSLFETGANPSLWSTFPGREEKDKACHLNYSRKEFKPHHLRQRYYHWRAAPSMNSKVRFWILFVFKCSTIFSRDAPVFAMLGGSRRMGKGTICLCIYTHKKAKTCIYLYTAAQTAQAEQTEKPWYSMYNSIKLCCSNHIYSDPNTTKVKYLLFIPVKICSEEIFTKMKQKIKSTFLGPATPFHRATQYIKSSFHFSGSHLCNGWEDSFVI